MHTYDANTSRKKNTNELKNTNDWLQLASIYTQNEKNITADNGKKINN